MKRYNIIAVFDKNADRLLFCRRRRAPYRGLLNFVGGKIEPGEDGLAAAYRELREETSITPDDITLVHFMDFTYYMEDSYMEVYVGKLNKSVSISGEENELCWSDQNHNFFDSSQYAGRGNIGHILNMIRAHQDQLF